jgi:predicted enzyme related to lactoylglutathione lyase
MAGVPSHWNSYFAVSDADAAAARAQAAGGMVLQPPFDSPFGRIAVLADPQGAGFSIVAMPEA